MVNNIFSCSHRPNMNQSFLCDPDGLLQAHAADMIEEQLALIRQKCKHPCDVTEGSIENSADAQPTTECRIAVALVGELPPGKPSQPFISKEEE
jgi:hypothetical protein